MMKKLTGKNMKKTEQFLQFIDERIKLASSIQTESAYIVVKDAFKKIFKDDIDSDIDQDGRYQAKLKDPYNKD